MSNIATFKKTPNETIDIVISFSEFLIEKNDELDSFDVTMPSGLTLLDKAVLPDRAKLMIRGGSITSVNGKPKTNQYTVSLLLTTRSGIQTENFITILVGQEAYVDNGGVVAIPPTSNPKIVVKKDNAFLSESIEILNFAGQSLTVSPIEKGVTISVNGSTSSTPNTVVLRDSNGDVSLDINGGTISNLNSDISVSDGGTGKSSFTENGILFGDSTNPLKVTSAGVSGQILQSGQDGTPFFGDIDGGIY